MSLKYLLDENVDPNYKIQLLQRNSDGCIWAVGEPGTPAKGCLDPEILSWCEDFNFILVTNNRRSMPVHLAAHLIQGRHLPGIFILSTKLSMGQNIEELLFLAEISWEDEYQDQIVHLPYSYSLPSELI